jgi:ABC-type nickel/cobalt efflux system permease component RcnA
MINWEMMNAVGTISMSVVGALGIWLRVIEERRARCALEKQNKAHRTQIERHHKAHEVDNATVAPAPHPLAKYVTYERAHA